MVTIIEEKQNPLFARKEINLEVSQETVPSHEEAKKIVCDKFKCDGKLVKIRKIDSRFGSKSFNIIVDIYNSKDEFDRVVKKTKQEVEAEKKAEEERIQAELEAKEAEKAAKAEAEAKSIADAAEEMAKEDESPSESEQIAVAAEEGSK